MTEAEVLDIKAKVLRGLVVSSQKLLKEVAAKELEIAVTSNGHIIRLRGIRTNIQCMCNKCK